MDMSLFLIIGLGISGLLVAQPKLPTILLASLYWFIVVGWSLNLFDPFTFNTTHWLSLFNINIAYHSDGLAKLFSLLISGIGILILFYDYIYTSYEKHHRARLLSLLQIFAISMLGIVVADDMIMLFVCWELTAITSYLLIQFDFDDPSANKAAFNSLFVTVLGSFIMLVGFILLNNLSGSWSIAKTILQMSDYRNSTELIAAFFLILCGATTKSAQFPFYFWLPGAMKAPTPVSAYLHSATMVNAGIYLLARLHPLFSQLSLWYPVMSFVGLTTMLIAGLLSVLQNDFKALLAYTTIFALGAMVYLLSSYQPLAIAAFAIFLLFHGIYKAAAFMLVGTLNKEYNTKLLDKLTGVGRSKVLLAITIIIVFGSMAGLPPFFGFTIKQMIFEAKLAAATISYFLMAISILSSMLVAAASFRCTWFLFKPTKNISVKIKKLRFGLICPAILAALILTLSFFERNLQNLIAPTVDNVLSTTYSAYSSPNIWISYLLSLITVVGGAVLCALTILLNTLPAHWPKFLNPRILFEYSLKYLLLFGKKLTHLTQGKPLATQLQLILSSIIIFLMIVIITTQQHQLLTDQFSLDSKNLLLSLLIISTTFSLLISTKFLYNLISLSLVGLVATFFFMINGAVDVAMTQLLIEVLTIIIFLIALRKLHPHEKINHQPTKIINIIIATAIGLYTTLVMLELKTIPFDNQLQQYYIKNSLLLAYGRNVVNVILVDFRSFDTLGEVIVIITATIGVLVLAQKSLQFIRKRNVDNS